jgi:hypothetical protein
MVSEHEVELSYNMYMYMYIYIHIMGIMGCINNTTWGCSGIYKQQLGAVGVSFMAIAMVITSMRRDITW